MAITTSLAAALLGLMQAAPAVPVTPGTISIEPAAGAENSAGLHDIFADAVETALLQADFIALPNPSPSRYIMRIAIDRSTRGEVAASGGPVAGPNLQAGGSDRSAGGGLTITMPTSKRQLRALAVTRLDLTIVQRNSGAAVWSGKALTVTAEGTDSDDPALIARKLATALLRHFPAPMPEPISVP
jgi:hypothetical protein